MSSDYRKIEKKLKKLGWEISRTRRHRCFISPDGLKIYTAMTPSDFRAIANLKSRIKRMAGVEI